MFSPLVPSLSCCSRYERAMTGFCESMDSRAKRKYHALLELLMPRILSRFRMNDSCQDIVCSGYSWLVMRHTLSQRKGTDRDKSEDTCVFRTMIFNTFASQKSVKMHTKSTLREALEPTWTALGHPGAKTPQKRRRNIFSRVHFGVDLEPFVRPEVSLDLSGT